MIRYVKVREGNTGILYITEESGKQERYIPDYDLDKARNLLLEFQELKDTKGNVLKDNYRLDGYNWYPTMVSYLYWRLFFQYIKYKPLVDQAIDKEIDFEFGNQREFYRLINLIRGEDNYVSLKTKLFYNIVELNNLLVIKRNPAQLLFFRFSVNDFRSIEIKRTLDELQAEYIQVLPPTRIVDALKNLFRARPFYFLGGVSSKRVFNQNYDLSEFDRYKAFLFGRTVDKLEWSISNFLVEYRKHLKLLQKTRIKTFYGLDDGDIFPILYACQKNGIKTIGHQHGAYVRRRACVVKEAITRGGFRWFDKIIVWGDYWRDHVLRISNVYSPEMFVVGSNKLSFDCGFSNSSNPKPKNILIPYEFLTNTYKIGRYMIKFMDLGYNVYFKPRTDEKLADQLEAYCLPQDYLNRINIVEKIDNNLMANIDIIAGTMTTLIYELLPYKKIIWVLDTEYRHLEDLVEGGYAQKVRYEDLDTLDESYFKRTEVDAHYFFNPETLRETLSKHVLSLR